MIVSPFLAYIVGPGNCPFTVKMFLVLQSLVYEASLTCNQLKVNHASSYQKEKLHAQIVASIHSYKCITNQKLIACMNDSMTQGYPKTYGCHTVENENHTGP